MGSVTAASTRRTEVSPPLLLDVGNQLSSAVMNRTQM
jgi:hypothetical protein